MLRSGFTTALSRRLGFAALVLAIAVACLFGVVSGVRHGRPVRTSIEELRLHSDRYAGQRVEIAGQLDECVGWECSLCPHGTQSIDNQCLALGFRPFIPDTDFGKREQQAIYRFADVVVTATFDPSCWKLPCREPPDVLHDTEVVSIGPRRSARAGLWSSPPTRLVELDGVAARDLDAAARQAGFPGWSRIRAYRTVTIPSRFIACFTWLEGELGSWPVSLEGALSARSTLDLYRCDEIADVSGRWILQTSTS